MFYIQVNNPFPDYSHKGNPISVYDFLEVFGSAFSAYHRTESLIIYFNGILIPINFDNECLLNDLYFLLNKLVFEGFEGYETLAFHEQDEYQFCLNIEFSGEKVVMEIVFNSFPNEIINLISKDNFILELSRNDFLAEWKMLTKKYLDLYDCAKNKYEIEIEDTQSYYKIKSIFEAIPCYGILYKHLDNSLSIQ